MKKLQILLAEDNPDHQALLRMAILRQQPSASVTIASNREELVTAAHRRRYDCILLDYEIPPHTAPELLREVEPLQSGVPCIVVSSSDEQSVVIESIRRGVADFLPKQEAIDGRSLGARIEAVVATARAQQLERRRLNRRLKTLQTCANTDTVTGLLNRRATDALLQSAGRRTDRRGQTAIIMLDLDHFKQVNDALGHAEGDRVLRDTARVLKGCANDTDVVARWGGEEFLVLRQSTNLTEAWVWADKTRREIARCVELPAQLGAQTASLGVDIVPPQELSVDAVSRADRAMYLAKDCGRNRVCTWQMVEAMEIAHTLGTLPHATPRTRLLMLIDKLRSTLGPTQIEHIDSHCLLVAQLCGQVCRRLAMDPITMRDVDLAAQFHDVGKLCIPESLLSLPRGLSDGERRFVNEHARFGAELLKACGASHRAVTAVEDHHRRFDSIQESDREAMTELKGCWILSACDAMIAMRSDRSYARARTSLQALAELRAHRGKQFHPDVVDELQLIDHARTQAA